MSAVHPGVTGRRAFSVRDFGEAYGVGKTTTFAEIAAGRLKAVKAGGKTLIPAASADAWFAALPAVKAQALNSNEGGGPT